MLNVRLAATPVPNLENVSPAIRDATSIKIPISARLARNLVFPALMTEPVPAVKMEIT